MHMDVDVRHLKLVATVAQCGSLTRAGEQLHLTQSALSHQLRDLESRLAVPLFLRVGKRMVLTPAGDRLLASARRVLAEIETTEDEIRRLAGDRQGPIRITTECYTCYHWLPPLLKVFRRKHPKVDVRIEVEWTRRPLEPLLDGRLDLALVTSRVNDRRIVMKELFRDDLVAVASPSHPLAARRRVDVEDLTGETLFTYSPKEESQVYARIIEPAGARPRLEPVPLTEAMMELVKAGLGVAFLARWAVQPHLEAGALKILPIRAKGLGRVWSAAMLKQTAQLPHVIDFVELLSAAAPRRPGQLPAVTRAALRVAR
jgi:LysR family transcriptional regulator for metE and metH